MIPVLTLNDIQKICKSKYDFDEKRIVAIMIARYTIKDSQEMIKSQYEFWHYWTGKSLDFFWLGYGGYIFPRRDGQHLIGKLCDTPEVFFDTRVFVNEVQTLASIANIDYNDSIGVFLCNYYEGNLHFNESAYINLDYFVTAEHKTDLRNFACDLIRICKKNHNVTDVILKLKIKKASYRIKDINMSSIITDTLKNTLKSPFNF